MNYSRIPSYATDWTDYSDSDSKEEDRAADLGKKTNFICLLVNPSIYIIDVLLYILYIQRSENSLGQISLQFILWWFTCLIVTYLCVKYRIQNLHEINVKLCYGYHKHYDDWFWKYHTNL